MALETIAVTTYMIVHLNMNIGSMEHQSLEVFKLNSPEACRHAVTELIKRVPMSGNMQGNPYCTQVKPIWWRDQ